MSISFLPSYANLMSTFATFAFACSVREESSLMYESMARAPERSAIDVPSINERERKAFEGRRPAGRAGVARVSGESVRVSLCHLRVGTRQRCYRNLSDVCLPVRRRRVVAVSVEKVCLRIRCYSCVHLSRSNRSVWRIQRPSKYILLRVHRCMTTRGICVIDLPAKKSRDRARLASVR